LIELAPDSNDRRADPSVKSVATVGMREFDPAPLSGFDVGKTRSATYVLPFSEQNGKIA